MAMSMSEASEPNSRVAATTAADVIKDASRFEDADEFETRDRAETCGAALTAAPATVELKV